MVPEVFALTCSSGMVGTRAMTNLYPQNSTFTLVTIASCQIGYFMSTRKRTHFFMSIHRRAFPIVWDSS